MGGEKPYYVFPPGSDRSLHVYMVCVMYSGLSSILGLYFSVYCYAYEYMYFNKVSSVMTNQRVVVFG